VYINVYANHFADHIRVSRLVSPSEIHQKGDNLLQFEEHTFPPSTPQGLQHDVGSL